MLPEFSCIITLSEIDEILPRGWLPGSAADTETGKKVPQRLGKDRIIEKDMRVKTVVRWGLESQLNAGEMRVFIAS